MRFKTLYDELRGVSPSTLSSILKQLELRGIVGRRSFAEIPPRVEYSLTANGLGLKKAILPLLMWASEQDDYAKRAASCDPSQYVRVAISTSEQVSGGWRSAPPPYPNLRSLRSFNHRRYKTPG
ncbi:MAG: helix-turn-helix transcriptional regulator [Nitrososphaerota archaeon]|nr:helix-turn-helix transcriptional regulator [Nitrososphaerota archaeon]